MGLEGLPLTPGPESTDVSTPYSRKYFRHFRLFLGIIPPCLPDCDAGWAIAVAQLAEKETEAQMNEVICSRSSSLAGSRRSQILLRFWPPITEQPMGLPSDMGSR